MKVKQSQPNWLVALADTHPKPTKEFALPTHRLTRIMHETPIEQTAPVLINHGAPADASVQHRSGLTFTLRNKMKEGHRDNTVWAVL